MSPNSRKHSTLALVVDVELANSPVRHTSTNMQAKHAQSSTPAAAENLAPLTIRNLAAHDAATASSAGLPIDRWLTSTEDNQIHRPRNVDPAAWAGLVEIDPLAADNEAATRAGDRANHN